MKHYLNEFANPGAYNTAKAGETFYRPAVSLIDSSHDVMYDPKFYFNPRYLYSDLSTSKNLDSSKTVIGIEVIPKKHNIDKKARFMSVKNMSRSNPEGGSVEIGNDSSNPATSIPWGNLVEDQSIPGTTVYQNVGHNLDNDSEAVTESNPFGLLNQLSSSTTSDLVTDFDNGLNGNRFPFFEDTYLPLYQTPSSMSRTLPVPYPFNEDGTKNLLYWNNGEGMAITDMSGFDNTSALINHINIEGWQTGELNTTVNTSYPSERKNYPAAAACYRFNPANSDTAHQWYLPSVGELGYLMANIVKINAKIDALPNGQGVKVGMFNSQTAPRNSFGGYLRTSTQSSVGIGWCLRLDSAVNNYDSDLTEIRVRAFIAI